MKNLIIGAVVIVVIAVGGWFGYSKLSGGLNSAASPAATDVVAIVNGQELSTSELAVVEAQIAVSQGINQVTLSDEDASTLRAAALDALIGQVLIEQAVTASGITATSEEIETQFTAVKGKFESEEAFSAALTAEGLTVTTFQNKIATDLATQVYLTKAIGVTDVSVTEAEVKAAYDSAIVGVDNAPAFADAHDQIQQALSAQKQQALITKLVEELRAAATIVIN